MLCFLEDVLVHLSSRVDSLGGNLVKSNEQSSIHSGEREGVHVSQLKIIALVSLSLDLSPSAVLEYKQIIHQYNKR